MHTSMPRWRRNARYLQWSIIDPIVFAKQFVPATYLQTPGVFDFTDRENAAANQLFSEVVSSLAAGFSSYTNDDDREHRITNIEQDSLGFAASLSQAVETAYRWRENRDSRSPT